MEHADVRLSVRRQSRLQRRPGTSVYILGTRTCRVLRTPKGPGTDSRSGIAKHAHGRFYEGLRMSAPWWWGGRHEGPAYANLQGRNPREMWRGCASVALGISALAVRCRGELGACATGERG